MNRKLKVEELNRPEIDQFKKIEKLPVVVVLDNIRSFHNVGSVFRTADAFRFEQIILCGITPQPPHREIHKTALGATESVDWIYQEDTLDVLKKLKADGYKLLSLEQTSDSVMMQDFKPEKNEKYVVILGNEVFGVQQEVIDLCDNVIEIPQEGTKHSLNVSVSAGMIMWHIFSHLRF